MADRTQYFFRQQVDEAELNLGFALLEKADQILASDLSVYGIISGAVAAPHAPVPDLSIDLTAPARGYDHLGQRLFFGTGQTVNCAVDLVGLPTEVLGARSERWLGVFWRFRRRLSDPRTDGNSQQIYFRQDESFELVVRQAPEAPVGTATRVELQPGEILICDVRRLSGQYQFLEGDIDSSRRQNFVFAKGSSVAVTPALWTTLAPLAPTTQATFDEVDAELRDHYSGAARRHGAASIDFTPKGFVSGVTVQAALEEVVTDLTSAAAAGPGALWIGVDALPGTPSALPAGSVRAALAGLLSALNAHQGKVTGAHAASAIAVADAANTLTAVNVEAALSEILDAFAGDHFRGSETNAGQHRAIHQPIVTAVTRALLWDAQGTGGMASRFRVHADGESVWFTVNASWNGNAWARDTANYAAGGFRFSRNDFEILQDASGTATFVNWQRSWRLPLSASVNSAFELTGTVSESGRCGGRLTIPITGSQGVELGSSVSFRSRFPASPSSITLSPIVVGSPTPTATAGAISRDGFGLFLNATITAYTVLQWFGEYVAIA